MTTTTDILDVIRQRVGRRHNISRAEMRDILLDLPIDIIEQSTIGGRDSNGQLILGGGGPGEWVAVPHDPETERRAIAAYWANMCRDIRCISASAESVRYDEPGRMHPLHHAAVIFAPADLDNYEDDQIGQMRRHADRLLIVADDPALEVVPPAPAKQHPAMRFRHRDLDGAWNRILPDGTLQRLDVNDGQDRAPGSKIRHQWRVDAETGEIFRRRLPPEDVGDAWRDIGVPEWEPCDPYSGDDLLYRYYECLAL